MKYRILIASLFYSAIIFSQNLQIKIKEEPPYYVDQDINLEIYLNNSSPDTLQFFDSRGPSFDSFKESWDLMVNYKFEELLSLNTAFEGSFADSIIRTLFPGDTCLVRNKSLHLNETGTYRVSYGQEQSADFIQKQYADTSINDSVWQCISAFAVEAAIEFTVYNEYDTTISELLQMPWDEWKDYRHVQLYSRDHFYDNIYAALKHPQEVYALHLYCNGLSDEEIKRVSRLKNLKALKLFNFELDTFPEEIAALNLYELTILPKKDSMVSYVYGLSKNKTLRELRMLVYGNFPEQVLEQKALINLDMSESTFQSLPGFQNLLQLEVLNLSDCKLKSIQEAGFQQLPKLKDLNLSGNREIMDLKPLLNCLNLEILFINRTRIDSIPHDIEKLSKLKKLSISNSLTAISDSIGNLSDLRFLSLGGNTKLDYVPASLIKLNKLLYLNLNRTGIVELPEGIAELPLEEITLQGTNCKVTKDYKELRKRLKENFKE
jgi:hypothetical protein